MLITPFDHQSVNGKNMFIVKSTVYAFYNYIRYTKI